MSVNGLAAWGLIKVADGRNVTGANADFSGIPRRSRAVDDMAIHDDHIEDLLVIDRHTLMGLRTRRYGKEDSSQRKNGKAHSMPRQKTGSPTGDDEPRVRIVPCKSECNVIDARRCVPSRRGTPLKLLTRSTVRTVPSSLPAPQWRSEEHTSELQSLRHLV